MLSNNSTHTRRRVLHALGTGSTTALAGCSSIPNLGCPSRVEPTWQIDGRYWSPPTITENNLYVSERYGATGSDVSRILCASGYDGQERWVETVDGAGAGVPQVHAGVVYVGTGLDTVRALDAETGQRIWTYDAGGVEAYGGGAWGKPAIVRDTVVVGISHSEQSNPDPNNPDDFTHRVVALDRDTGTERWSYTTDGMVFGGPAVADDRVYVTSDAGRLHRLDAETGAAEWTIRVGEQIRTRPIVADGWVYAAAEGGAIRATSQDSASELYASAGPTETTAVAGTADRAFVGTAGGLLTAFQSGDGRVWRHETPAAVAAVAIDDGLVWLLGQDGFLTAVTLKRGDRVQRLRIGATRDDECGWQPDSADGTGLIVRDGDAFVTGPAVFEFCLS